MSKDTITILGFAGSLRKGSYNKAFIIGGSGTGSRGSGPGGFRP